MPYQIKKVKDKFQVINTQTKKIHAKGTTKVKAENQIKLLKALEKK